MKIYTIVRVQGVDIEQSDLVTWGEVLSDWNEPDMEVGQSVVFVMTKIDEGE
jgi:hypothetical protein